MRTGQALLTGVLVIFSIIVITSLLMTMITHLTTVEEQTMHNLLIPVMLVALFIGGCFAGFRSGKRGWYIGALTGIIFLVIVGSISFFGMDATFSTHTIILYVIYCILASIGGIIGVQLSPDRTATEY